MIRPDISNAVTEVARHARHPTDPHWKAVQKILSYLKGTKELGITFCRDAPNKLQAFEYSSYAPQSYDRRSTSSSLLVFCGGPIMWFSRMRESILLSSTEAEYIAMADSVKDVFARQMFFVVPGMKLEIVVLYEDNSGAIHLANNRQ